MYFDLAYADTTSDAARLARRAATSTSICTRGQASAATAAAGCWPMGGVKEVGGTSTLEAGAMAPGPAAAGSDEDDGTARVGGGGWGGSAGDL